MPTPTPLLKALAALALAVSLGAGAARAENPEDKVYLTFTQFPVAGRPVDYAVRNLCGNTCTSAVSELKADVPMTGETRLNMTRLGSWCYSSGKVTFPTAGQAQVLVNVNVRNPNNNFYFQDRMVLTVHPAREE